MSFYGCIPRFVKDHLGWILSGLGCAGMIGTNVLTARAAPAAKEALEQAATDKEEDLTFWEKTKVLAKHYWPSALTGLGTMGCIIGGQMVSARQITGLVVAYGALAAQFDQYRGAIRDEYGEEADKKAFILAQAELKKTKALMAEMAAKNGPFLYGMAWMPGVIFEADPRDLEAALIRFNNHLILHEEGTIGDLNRFLDIPESCWNDDKDCDRYGFNAYESSTSDRLPCVTFSMFEVETKNGTIRIIYMASLAPYRLDMDYACDGRKDDPENMYPGYNMPLAIERARQIGANDIIQTAHPAAHLPVYCLG